MITLKLTDSIQVVEERISQAFAKHVNDQISKKQNKLLSDCQSLVSDWILSQPEIKSLSSSTPDSLAGQFGIRPESAARISTSIVESVKSSISLKFIKFNAKLQGGLEVYFQPTTFLNLLNLPEGHTIYSGGDLHWMEWLLRRGDTVIVANYQYNPQSGTGRSGLGYMSLGSAFRVPPQFSGLESNNFITRALVGEEQEAQITKIFQQVLGD